jgi:ABC-type phosphate transport system substrate-binding protein
MRTTIALATFLVVGAGAAGVSALDLKGSDTLKELTRDLFGNDTPFAQDCGGTGNTPAGTINYIGTGSGNGQSAVLGTAPTQQIAPMSRGFNNGVCGQDPTHAEGIVFALDGLSIVANAGNFGSTACNGTVDPNCGRDTTVGLALNKTITLPDSSTYTFTTWRDVLRVLYSGMSTPGDTSLANRNCNSTVRQALAANWSLLFQGTCASGNCPAGVKHAFRRNEESGTTDVFVTLLQLPTASQGGNLTSFCNVATQGSGSYNTATNVFTPAAPADTHSGPLPTPPAGFGATPVPTEIGGVVGNKYFGPYFTDLQDGDVIRRPCDGNGLVTNTAGEDVCSARGDLGLVLPIWDAPVVNPGETAFPNQQCASGLFAVFSNNDLRVANCTNNANCFDTCPNGVHEGIDPNSLLSAGSCAYPVRSSTTSPNDPRCLNSKANKLSAELPAATPNNVDGRVYNLHLWSEDPSAPGTFVHAKSPRASGQNPPVLPTVSISMVGAYYRIHQSHTLATVGGSAALCQQPSATQQIGCLVQASPCSIGYAGREAAGVSVNGVQGAFSLKNDGVDPQVQCVRNLIASPFFPAVGSQYPIARRLFLNTMKGFDNVTGDENKAAVCFQNRNITDTIATNRGFITLSDTAASRPSYCFDFNEAAAAPAGCAAASNVDQCKNHVAGSPFPKCEEQEGPTTCH